MSKCNYFVSLFDAYDCVYKAMFEDDVTQNIFSSEGEEFKRGAMWGMNWALCHIFRYCPVKFSEENDA